MSRYTRFDPAPRVSVVDNFGGGRNREGIVFLRGGRAGLMGSLRRPISSGTVA